MKEFEHFNAVSIEEVISFLRDFNGKAVLIAGGTDLIGTLKGNILLEYPKAVINIKGIPDMAFIKEGEDGLEVGALARLVDIVRSPIINDRYSVLAEAAMSVGSPEIRNMGTLGGNLCQDTRCWYYRYPHQIGGRIQCLRKGKGSCLAVKGDNRYHAILGGKKCFAVCNSDMAIALAALDARIRVVGVEGERIIPIMDFFQTMGTVLSTDEMVYSINVPCPSDRTEQKFIKFRVKEAPDFAIVSVATAVEVKDSVCQDVRIIVGAVAPTPYRARNAEKKIIGKNLGRAEIEEAAKAAVVYAKPLSRNAYKVEIVKTLVRRALSNYIHQ